MNQAPGPGWIIYTDENGQLAARPPTAYEKAREIVFAIVRFILAPFVFLAQIIASIFA